MRSSLLNLIIALALALALSGCKLVKNEDPDAQRASESGSVDKITAFSEDIWEAKAVPHFDDAATPLSELAPTLAADLDAAGAAHGYRKESEGSPWNFATTFSGVVTAANTESRAATADIDIDGDGTPDATLQLGPVIRGTTLRDALPFVVFTDFRDQIEFAQLGRALNDRAYRTTLEALPRDNLVGASVDGLGAFTMRGRGDKILITPIRLNVEPKS